MKLSLNEVLNPTPLPRSRELREYEADIATIRAAGHAEMSMMSLNDGKDLHAMYYATLTVAAIKEAAQLRGQA